MPKGPQGQTIRTELIEARSRVLAQIKELGIAHVPYVPGPSPRRTLRKRLLTLLWEIDVELAGAGSSDA